MVHYSYEYGCKRVTDADGVTVYAVFMPSCSRRRWQPRVL
eukprot:SAG31_NODE_45451_length_258_cov_2.566038_1_plen_39_part_10